METFSYISELNAFDAWLTYHELPSLLTSWNISTHCSMRRNCMWKASVPRRLCLTMASKCGGKPLRTKVVMIWPRA